jgi:O-methyltransferase involved in polyketide biosynthesis
MVDDQAVIVFLRQLDQVLSDALRGDEQQRLRRLTMTHALVMAVLADARQLDQALRQAAAGLARLEP